MNLDLTPGIITIKGPVSQRAARPSLAAITNKSGRDYYQRESQCSTTAATAPRISGRRGPKIIIFSKDLYIRLEVKDKTNGRPVGQKVTVDGNPIFQ